MKKTYINYYTCSCGTEWSDIWNCTCNDRCPKCNKEIEPCKSEDITTEQGEGDENNHKV